MLRHCKVNISCMFVPSIICKLSLSLKASIFPFQFSSFMLPYHCGKAVPMAEGVLMLFPQFDQ